jgi:hypothetical protein
MGRLLSALGDPHITLVYMPCTVSWVKLCLGLLAVDEASMTASHTSRFCSSSVVERAEQFCVSLQVAGAPGCRQQHSYIAGSSRSEG